MGFSYLGRRRNMGVGTFRVGSALLAAFMIVGGGRAQAEAPKILALRVQEVNGVTYFQVRFQAPANFAVERRQDDLGRIFFGFQREALDPLLRARLVPQGKEAKAVYLQLRPEDLEREFGMPLDEKFPVEKEPLPDPVGEKGLNKDPDKGGPVGPDKGGPRAGRGRELEFLGKVSGAKAVTFLLLYPAAPVEKSKPAKGKEQSILMKVLADKQHWAEEKVQLDFSKAKKLAVPEGGFQRAPERMPKEDDLEGQWALAQATHFGMLAAGTPDFGFYGLARESTLRKYKLPTQGGRFGPGRFQNFKRDPAGTRRLYEVTTGAAAITESLAMQRMRERRRDDKDEPRAIAIEKVRGIEIDEHPWTKMMAGKKPAPERLAELVPHDNYYVHFRTIGKFLEAGDLLEQWGAAAIRAYEVQTKDYRIKERLEQQLCLKSSGVARILGPAVVKGVAITGSDPYIREGTDVTLLFHLANKDLFLFGVNPHIAAARKKFGTKLKEDKAEHSGVVIESFTTPLREVSLHRAIFDNVAVYSNSPVGLRRVIDAAKGKIKPLSASLDFQYMRTIFRADDKDDDGFVFLSDPFIRNLVGPATRIKERRRLEALTSLQMVTHGAMFTAWETGRLPLHHQEILDTTGMTPAELFTPDGGGAIWDRNDKIASSAVYNTLHFATPLIELPIDHVTRTEAAEYEDFRRQYLGLWRQFFDPIGMRLTLNKDEVRWETYILPLVRNSSYNELRRFTGGGSIKVDPKFFGDKVLAQFLVHLSPDLIRDGPGGIFGPGWGDDFLMDLVVRSWLGEWATVRLDDSPIYRKLLETYIARELDPGRRHDFLEDIELALQIPLTFGVEIRNPLVFTGILATIRKSVDSALPGAVVWRPMEPYKDVSIVQVRSRPRTGGGLVEGPGAGRIPQFAFYYALVDGAFYLSLREEPIKDLIDRDAARKEKGEKARARIDTNSSLYLSPGAMKESKDLLTLYLEWTTHQRAQANNRLIYALFRSNLAGPADASEQVEAAALQFLGYVPVSPDDASFGYDAVKDEVFNRRHGTLRSPKLHAGIEPTSPVGQLLRQLDSIRADLRFREDGIHTVLTIRKSGKK